MLAIAAGNSPQFRITPIPAGIATSADNIGYAVEISDGSPITWDANPDDATGMTSTLTIDPSATVGAVITMWAVYRNADGREAVLGPWAFTVT